MSLKIQNYNELLVKYNILEQENINLKRKLHLSKSWMQKEVHQARLRISKQHESWMTITEKKKFLDEIQPNIIEKMIIDYFWELLLLNAPSSIVEHLVDAEFYFYRLKSNSSVDALSVTWAYQKVLDILIDKIITTPYRKFVVKKKLNIQLRNNLIEKSLALVVNKRYTLSFWRFYWLVKEIKNNNNLWGYTSLFKEFLEKYPEKKELILWDYFYKEINNLIKTEIFTVKRHHWKITLEEAELIRNILVWKYKNKESLIYKILESDTVLY